MLEEDLIIGVILCVNYKLIAMEIFETFKKEITIKALTNFVNGDIMHDGNRTIVLFYSSIFPCFPVARLEIY